MRIKELTQFLEETFPLAFQEDYDNSGFLIGDLNMKLSKALIAVDITESVIDEAIATKSGLIISHHPLIFGGLKKITGRTYVERVIQKAIQNNIGIYAIHTNLDNHIQGLNHILATKFGLINQKILQPKTGTFKKIVTFCPAEHAAKVRFAILEAGAGRIGDYDCCSFNTIGEGTFRPGSNANPFVGKVNELHTEKEVKIEAIFPAYLEKAIITKMIDAHPYQEVAYDILLLGNENKYIGSGITGELEKEMPASTFLGRVKNICELPVIKFSGNIDKPVSRVALCGGSGAFLISDAIKSEAQIYLTGDLKYHDYFIPEDKMILADIGHYESEQFSKDLIAQVLVEKFPTFAVLKTKENTNPVKYL